MYHYGANNPVKYTDPDGKLTQLWLEQQRNKGNGKRSWKLFDDDILKSNTGNNNSKSKDEEKKPNDISDSLKDNAQAPSAAAGSPAPNDDNNSDENTDDGDYYESNPKHNQNAKGNVGKEPENAKEMFEKSVKDKQGRRWYKDKNGELHRFEGNNKKYHWNGSYKGKPEKMPSYIDKSIRTMPNGDI